MLEVNSTTDHTYRRGRALPDYNGKSITILDIPCIRIKREDEEDEIMFSSLIASRIDTIMKTAGAKSDELGKQHLLVGYTEHNEPIWYN